MRIHSVQQATASPSAQVSSGLKAEGPSQSTPLLTLKTSPMVSPDSKSTDKHTISTQKGSAVSSLSLQGDPPFSQRDLGWFVNNRQAFETGLTPNAVPISPQDEKKYTNILQQLQQNQSVSQKDMDWAIKLENSILEGSVQTFKPTPEEAKQFDEINHYLKENNLKISPRAFNGPQVYYALVPIAK